MKQLMSKLAFYSIVVILAPFIFLGFLAGLVLTGLHAGFDLGLRIGEWMDKVSMNLK